MAGSWLTATEATALLGVKPATLYAYVSRGLVARERAPGSRTSRYARADVERLAGRGRAAAVPSGGVEVTIETALTLLDPAGHLHYRGWDVTDAADAGFEVVSHWLWTGERPADEVVLPTPSALPALDGVDGLDRVRAVLAVARQRDPQHDNRRPGAVAETGRTIVATMIEALPARQPPLPHTTVAARLWTRLTDRRPRVRDLDVLDATLVALADHELAASTLAARVAASTWADPYLVVLAALAVLGGPLHGGVSERTRSLLREVAGGTTAADAIHARLAAGEPVPGFGHAVYRSRDPRADLLLGRLELDDAASDLLAEMHRRRLSFPNADFALAALTEAHGMIPDAGEVIFAVARVAGWLAHAIEEYEHRLRFRPRATYVGVAPGS